jgi:hypothetical protein
VSVDSVPLVPPFTYNNQCGSVLLTTFIPVLLMGYTIQLVFPVAAMAVLTQIPHTALPPFCLQIFPGFLWPELWLQGEESFVHNKEGNDILNIRSILCNDVLNNWLLMLTFGLCSPILAVAIVCCVLVKMCMWMTLMGRFTSHMLIGSGDLEVDSASGASEVGVLSQVGSTGSTTTMVVTTKEEVVGFALMSLTRVRISLFTVLQYLFWRLACCSALFVGLLSWDLAGDEIGWLLSLWVPFLPFVYVLMLRCIAYYFNYLSSDSGGMDKKDVRQASVVVEMSAAPHRTSRNPLHEVDGSSTL